MERVKKDESVMEMMEETNRKRREKGGKNADVKNSKTKVIKK